jgi:hypothetical protein
MVSVILTVLGAWLVLAVLSACFVAALGRGGLREDQALEHLAVMSAANDRDEDGVAQLHPAGRGV